MQRQPGAQRLEISGRDLVHENENVERVNEELRVYPMLVGVERGGFMPRCYHIGRYLGYFWLARSAKA